MPKDPIAAFRGAGRGRYSVEKLIAGRRKDRADELPREESKERLKHDLRELRGKIAFRKRYDHKSLRKSES